MKNNTTRKTINVDKPNLMALWTLKQEDDVILKLSLFKEATPFNIVGQTIRLGAKTLKGLKEQIDGFTIKENELDIDLKNTILVPGIVEIDLEFKDAGGKMTSTSFFINVDSKVLNNAAVEETNEFDTFTKTVEEIQEDYQGLRKIVIDENNAANLQNQVNTVNSQLEQITDRYGEGFFNIDKGLAKFKTVKYPTIEGFGDSNTEGTGVDYEKVWLQRLKGKLSLKNGVYGIGSMGLATPDGYLPNNWVSESRGTNLRRMYTVDGAETLILRTLPCDCKVDIIYSTEIDGGSFKIEKNSSVIQTVSCNGSKSYGNRVTIDKLQTDSIKIIPTGKCYFEDLRYYGYDGLENGYLVLNMGHGGMGLNDYTKEEIEATITKNNPDLTIMAMLTNDVLDNQFENYKNMCEYTIQQAKLSGDCLILIQVESRAIFQMAHSQFLEYKKFLYDMAIKYNCALVDLDSYYGGYEVCESNGYFLDGVHMADKSHDNLANIMCNIIDKTALNCDSDKDINWTGNAGNFYYNGVKYKLPFSTTNNEFEVIAVKGAGTILRIKDIANNKTFEINMLYGMLEFKSDVFLNKFNFSGAVDFINAIIFEKGLDLRGFVSNNNNLGIQDNQLMFKNSTYGEVNIQQSIYNTVRPTGIKAGFSMLDANTNKPIWYTGSGWIFADGTSA